MVVCQALHMHTIRPRDTLHDLVLCKFQPIGGRPFDQVPPRLVGRYRSHPLLPKPAITARGAIVSKVLVFLGISWYSFLEKVVKP
jgi:hypothetical protein